MIQAGRLCIPFKDFIHDLKKINISEDVSEEIWFLADTVYCISHQGGSGNVSACEE